MGKPEDPCLRLGAVVEPSWSRRETVVPRHIQDNSTELPLQQLVMFSYHYRHIYEFGRVLVQLIP